MKFLLLIAISLLLSGNSIALKVDSKNEELVRLMNERKVLADEYYASLEKKSGFFGNKTKNDLRDSQDRLIAIVKADNKIMDALNRSLNYRDYEKINMKFDASSTEDRIRNLSVLNDTLNKQILRYFKENKAYRTTIKRHHMYFAGLIVIMLLAGWALIRNKLPR